MAATDARLCMVASSEHVHSMSLDCEPTLIFWTPPREKGRFQTRALESAACSSKIKLQQR